MWQVVLLAVLSVAYATPISDYVATTERIDTMKSYMPKGALSSFDERMRTKCLKYSNIEAYYKYKEAANNCSVEITKGLLLEMAKAVQREEEVTTMKLFCRLSPQITNCLTNLVGTVEQCMKPEDRGQKAIVANITTALFDYICYNDGERITKFIEDEGPECIVDREAQIDQCVNATVSNYGEEDSDESSENSLESIKVRTTEDECRNGLDMQKCVINQMKECSSPKPAMFVEGLLNSVLSVTPCAKFRLSA